MPARPTNTVRRASFVEPNRPNDALSYANDFVTASGQCPSPLASTPSLGRSPRRGSITRVAAAIAAGALLVGGFSSLAWPGLDAPRPASAREPVAYTLVDTWTSIRPTGAYTTLPWPDGHVSGGIGLNVLSTRYVVTDRTADTVRVYDEADRLIATHGGPGSGPGQFMNPRDTAILRDGRIVVSDTDNDRVQLLSAAGSPAGSWAVDDPRGIAAVTVNAGLPGEATFVVVVAAGARALELFEPGGTPRGRLLLSGTTTPDALADVELRLGPGGDPQVAASIVDAADGRLHVFDASGGSRIAAAHPYLRAALALRPPDSQSPGRAGEPAWWLGISGLGLRLQDGEGRALPPATDLPFAGVSDLARARRSSGRVLAAVMPEGLITLGDDPQALADRLATNTAGRLFQPARIAIGADVLLADRLPRIILRDRAGASPDEIPLPSRPLSDDVPRAIDVAATSGLRFALVDDGRVLLEANQRFNRFRAAPIDRPTYRWAIAGAGGRLSILDLLAGEVEIVDDRLDRVDAWDLAQGDGVTLPADLALVGDTTWLAAPGAGVLETRTSTGRKLVALPVPGIPERVAAGPRDAYALTAAGWVYRYDIGGNPIAAWPVAEGGDRPVDLAVDDEDRVYVVDERGAVRVYAPDPDPPSPAPAPPVILEGTCRMTTDKRAAPRDLNLGETVTVTLSLAGSCAVPAAPVDVILAVDRSASMGDDGKLLAALEAVTSFGQHVDPATARIGVVDFGSQARAVLPPSADPLAAVRAVARMNAAGDTDLVGALREATELLAANPRAGAAGHVIVLTDGRHTAADPPATALDAAIAAARAAGVTLHAVALGVDADLEALGRIAGAPERLHRSPGPHELAGIYASVARGLGATALFASVVITDRLPADMLYVPDSAEPPAQIIEDGGALQWRLSDAPGPLIRIRYRLRPQEAGIHPTNREALAGGLDPLGVRHDLVFPVPEVRVFVDGRLPTAPPSPTPRAGASPTRTPTARPSPTRTASSTPTLRPTSEPSPTPGSSPTATATATATRRPTATARPTATPRGPGEPVGLVYLPILSTLRCPFGRRPIDVVLVLDTSRSMETVTSPGGPTRRDAATSAARDFVRLLDLSRDRAAVVGFHDRASLAAPLTADRARLDRALAGLTTAPGTRIDRGLEAAADALAPANPGRVPVVVLLTDGLAESTHLGTTLVAAQNLQRAGATVFAIGLGADVDATLLTLVASSPGLFLAAPSADDLASTFRAVAARIPCG